MTRKQYRIVGEIPKNYDANALLQHGRSEALYGGGGRPIVSHGNTDAHRHRMGDHAQ